MNFKRFILVIVFIFVAATLFTLATTENTAVGTGATVEATISPPVVSNNAIENRAAVVFSDIGQNLSSSLVVNAKNMADASFIDTGQYDGMLMSHGVTNTIDLSIADQDYSVVQQSSINITDCTVATLISENHSMIAKATTGTMITTGTTKSVVNIC